MVATQEQLLDLVLKENIDLPDYAIKYIKEKGKYTISTTSQRKTSSRLRMRVF